jgi:hypothetical protein
MGESRRERWKRARIRVLWQRLKESMNYGFMGEIGRVGKLGFYGRAWKSGRIRV